MINNFKIKIKDKKGASIAIALLMFLCCAVISTVIISAATVVSGRMSELKEQEGSYLITAGIANTMIKDLKSLQITIDTENQTATLSKPGGESAENIEIADFIRRAALDVYKNRGKTEYTGYTGTIIYSSESPVFSLTCTLVMDTEYNFTIQFNGVEDAKLSVVDAYNLTLASPATLSDTDSNKDTINILYSKITLEEI